MRRPRLHHPLVPPGTFRQFLVWRAIVVLLAFTCAAILPPSLPAATVTRDLASIASGEWSSPGTWSCGCVPTRTDRVIIRAGHVITLGGSAQAATVIVEGVLRASRVTHSNLMLDGNLVVGGAGWADYGTAASPIPAEVTARVRFFLDESRYVGGHTMMPQDTDVGVWVVGQGRLTTKGPTRSGWSRLTGTANAGALEVAVDLRFASGWRVGDELAIGPSHVPSGTMGQQDERRVIAADLGGGRFRLSAPLTYDHVVQALAWQDAWGGEWTERLAPPVANLTRNIVFDAASSDHRPHMMIIAQGRTELEDLAIVGFSPVPRFMPFARYALHWHMQRDASRGNFARNVVIRDGMGDGVHIHDSNGVILENVVVYNQARAYVTNQVQGVHGIDLEEARDTAGNPLPDRGANDAWVDRPLVLRFGVPRSQRASGIWLSAGVRAYVVGAHTAGGVGSRQSGIHWCEGCNNMMSADRSNPDRTPRVLRAVSHSNLLGYFWWVNATPQQDVIDLLAWNNRGGIELGAYETNFWLYHVRAIGNYNFQLSEHAVRTGITGFLADGPSAVASILVAPYPFDSSTDSVYEMGVVRNSQTAVSFSSCLQDGTCGSRTTRVQFSRVHFQGDPLIRYVWHPQSSTVLRFRSVGGLLRPQDFTLYRRDQTISDGTVDSAYEAVRVNGDTSGALAPPPRVRMAAGTAYPGCVEDEAVRTDLITLCVETDGQRVELYNGPREIADVPAAGNLIQVTFDLRTWPHQRSYFYAKSYGANGRVNYSRVIMVERAAPSGPVSTTPAPAPSPTIDAPPSVRITMPGDGGTVTGTVPIEITAADDRGISVVKILVDGILFARLLSAPYATTWNTAGWTAGSHRIRAVAVDTAGQVAEHIIQVTVALP